MVPPAKVAVVESVALWPLFMEVGLAEMVGANMKGSTVTVTAFDTCVSGVPALSVTWSSKDQTPELRAPVDTVGLASQLQLKELPRLL